MSRLDGSTLFLGEPVAAPFEWPRLPRASDATAPEAPRGRIEVEIGSARLRLDLGDVAPLTPPACRTIVSVDGATLELRHPADLLQRLMDAHAVPGDAAALGGEDAAIVAEHLLAPHLATLEAALGAPLRIEDHRPAEPMGAIRGGRIRLDGRDVGVLVLGGEPAVLARLAALDRREPARARAIPFEVRLLSRPFALPAGELAALEPGDAVLLDPRWGVPEPVLVRIGDRLEARVRGDGERRLLAEAPRRGGAHAVGRGAVDHARKGRAMEGPTAEAPDAGAAPDGVDELSVTVVLELDRTTMPLGEVERLREGSVLPFEGGLPDVVRLVANGAPFADGEMVQVGDRIGVRLIRLL